jgi:hypothetical protein
MRNQELFEIELLIRNGLTVGRMQDWEENLLQENTKFDAMLKKIPAAKWIKDAIGGLREKQANFLFNKFGAGLKIMSAVKTYEYALKKFPHMDMNARAKMVASLMNDDYGGLHHGRMGRDPTVQHIFRLFTLAPDWTESNVRTMIGMFKRLDRKGNPNAAKEQMNLYKRFWAGIAMKGIAMWIIGNIILAGVDEEYTFEERFKMAWDNGNLRWLDWDTTPIYRKLGYKGESRKYFRFMGHFMDPIKFVVTPLASAKHKGSVGMRMALEALSGTDWKGARFTTLSELLGGEGVTKWGTGRVLSAEQLPSYILNVTRSNMPVQIQNVIAAVLGEMESVDAVTKGLGLRTSSTYSSESDTKYGVSMYTDEFAELRSKVTKELKDDEENEKLLDAKGLLDYFAKSINLMKKSIDLIMEDDTMTESEKTKAIKELKAEIDKTAREGLDEYNKEGF